MSSRAGQPLSIVHAIARLNVGGAALHVIELAALQRERGHEVVVVAGTLAEGEESMEYVADDRGVPVVRLPALQRELSPFADAVAVRELRRTVTRRRADVLHTHTAKAGATGRAAARLARGGWPRTTVHTFHGHVLSGYFDSRREQAFIHLERMLARGTGAIIAVSDEVRDDLVALRVAPPEKIAVIPYGFDLSGRFRPDDAERARRRAALDIPTDAFVIGWAGRLTAIKRPEDLVRTAAEVRLAGTDAVLVVVGDGPERAGVEALARELGISAHCRFVGYQRDMGHWYGMFDAFLLTSENEGTPVAAIEALASECPVVATDAGGTATVVRHGVSGFIAPVGDTSALAADLHMLASQPGLARSLGAAGARDVAERFALGTMTDAVDSLYRNLLEASP
jgi:glycosyltransferase involved in cell wall biosynthesis